jgi:hypothetical protein
MHASARENVFADPDILMHWLLRFGRSDRGRNFDSTVNEPIAPDQHVADGRRLEPLDRIALHEDPRHSATFKGVVFNDDFTTGAQ